MLLLILIVLFTGQNNIEGFTTENLESINNIASMYENGSLKVTDLEVTGKATIPNISNNIKLTNSSNESVTLGISASNVLSVDGIKTNNINSESGTIKNMEISTVKSLNNAVNGYDPIYMDGDGFAFVMNGGKSDVKGFGYK